MRTIFALVLITLSACAHKSRRPAAENLAFPYGKYLQHVSVQHADRAPIEFQVVVQSSEHDLNIVGLSPAGTTAFRTNEDLCDGKINIQSFTAGVTDERLKQFSSWIKKIMFTAKGKVTTATDQGSEIIVSKIDAQAIPREINLHLPQLAIKFVVVSYELR